MTPDSIKASYARLLADVGEPILIRRYTGSGQHRLYFDASVLARVTNEKREPHEVAGTVAQDDKLIIVLVRDLIDAQFPMPVRKNDKAVVRGVEMNIEVADDSTRRVGAELVALELRVRG